MQSMVTRMGQKYSPDYRKNTIEPVDPAVELRHPTLVLTLATVELHNHTPMDTLATVELRKHTPVLTLAILEL